MTEENAGTVVSVLLATYNGAPYLDEQLASIERQTYPHIDIWASDDGSTDATRAVLEAWRGRWAKGRFTILPGPCRGYSENFRSLILNPDIASKYYAFSDQDDHWEPEKIARSVAWIKDRSGPALFCSRTLAFSDDGAVIGPSPLFKKTPSFRNALAQSLGGGNTMLYNRAAHTLLAEASRRTEFVSHDWWIYLIVAGAGGVVHYCPDLLVRYRQHVNNQFGSNRGLAAGLLRLRLMFRGRFAEWTALNVEGLGRNRDLLTNDALRTFDEFNRIRNTSVAARLYHLIRSGVYRQTGAGQIGLYVAAVLGKI